MFLIAALAPRIDADLGIGTRGTGVVVAAFFLAAAIGSIPGGRTADRLGSRRALQLGLVITVVATSLAATFGQGIVSLVLTLGLAGFALSLLDPGGARTLAAAVTSDRHGMAFGVKEASIPMASLLAGASLPLIPSQFGWRPSFIGAAVLAAVVAATVPRNLERRSPAGRAAPVQPTDDRSGERQALADRSRQADPLDNGSDELRPLEVDASGDARVDESIDTPVDPVADVPLATSGDRTVDPVADAPLATSGDRTVDPVADAPVDALVDDPRARQTSLLVLSLVAALGGGIAAGFSTYLVTSAVDGGYTSEVAGIIFAAASLAAVIVRLVVGRVADAGQPGRELRLLRGALVFGAVGIAISATATPATVVIGGVLGLGAGWGWTGLVFLAAVRIDPERPAAASGVVLAGLAIGGVIGPALFGVIADAAGFSMVFAFASTVMAAAGVVVSFPIRQIRSAALSEA